MDVPEVAAELLSRVKALPGWTVPSLRALRRTYSRQVAGAAARDVVQLAECVLEGPGIEYRFLAYELVCHHKDALRSLRAGDLERFGRGLDSWGAVDCFACYLAGPAWREGQVSDAWVRRWAQSPDRWRRRAALVCTVALNNRARGGRGDAERTLAVCRLLADDSDDMVVKALSWALRELAKRDPAAARGFLAERQGVLAARVVREVGNKLATGLKNPRRG